MDKKQTGEFMRKLTALYPNFELTRDRIEIWGEMLGDIEFMDAINNLKRYASENRFPPTIADILKPDRAARKKNNPEETQSVHALMAGGFELYDPDKH